MVKYSTITKFCVVCIRIFLCFALYKHNYYGTAHTQVYKHAQAWVMLFVRDVSTTLWDYHIHLSTTFLCIPYLPLMSVNTCEIFTQKVTSWVSKWLSMNSWNIAMNQLHSFHYQTSYSSLTLFISLKMVATICPLSLWNCSHFNVCLITCMLKVECKHQYKLH